jgi:serine phosphatase RsbU (regulator of sigma subunit)
MPGSFPLGIVPSVQYDDTAIELNPGDRCTLYTDGLLEARNAAGELYGFERLEELLRTRPDAAEAADAAVRFGQDDDITVVTLTRTKAPERDAFRQEMASRRREALDEISGEEIVA